MLVTVFLVSVHLSPALYLIWQCYPYSQYTVGTVCINVQPEYELASSIRYGQFQKFGKTSLSPRPPLRKQFLHGVWVVVDSYLRVRFDFPSSINFRDINGKRFPKLGAQNPYWVVTLEGLKWYHCILPVWFPISTRCHILHRFRDIVFDMSNIAIFGYPSCVQSPMEGRSLLQSTYYNEPRTTWPESSVKREIERMPDHFSGPSTGCQSSNESLTRWRLSLIHIWRCRRRG